jgi:hypothetical protein
MLKNTTDFGSFWLGEYCYIKNIARVVNSSQRN